MINRNRKTQMYCVLKSPCYLVMLVVLVLSMLNSNTKADDASRSKKIVLMTEEFRDFRRLMITIPDKKNLIPQIRSHPNKGEFEIMVAPVDITHYTSRKVIRRQGQYPLSLQISFPDSVSIKISGNTVPYQKLVGYHIFQEDLFIFDIYKHVPLESVFREKTVGISHYIEEDDYFNQAQTSVLYTSNEYSSNLFKNNGIQNRFWKAILFALIPLSVLLILFGLRKVIRRTLIPETNQRREDTIREQPVESVDIDAKELSPAELKELTQRVMEEKGVSYDEAMLLLNISGTSYDKAQ